MEDKANESKGLPYGVKLRCGNFFVEKVSRALSKREAREAKQELLKSLPKGFKGGQRASLPVIRVSDIAGVWRIEWAVSTSMYHVIDGFDNDGESITDATCNRLMTMLFCDTTVLGDSEYVRDRVTALNAFMGRIQAPEVSDEEEAKTLELLNAIDTLENGDDEREEGE